MLKVYQLNFDRCQGDDHVQLAFMDPTPLKAAKAFAEGKYDHVATVDTLDLDVAFQQTNHISHAWTENDDVEAHTDRPRSTSVGDIIVDVNDDSYLIAPIGFERIPETVVRITQRMFNKEN